MLEELYSEMIKDHGNRPRNCRLMQDATSQAPGFNRTCGDSLMLYLKVKDGVIEDASFVGDGCQIFKASASLMTDRLKGKTAAEAQELFNSVHEVLTSDVPISSELGKLAVLGGVRKFPMRVKCATLAWHTMMNALNHAAEPASTE